MLVIHIPKRSLFQDPTDIRHLKEDDRIFAGRDRAHGRKKSLSLPDVLERHFATYQIGRDLVRLCRKEFAYKPDILLGLLSFGNETWIVTNATISANLAY